MSQIDRSELFKFEWLSLGAAIIAINIGNIINYNNIGTRWNLSVPELIAVVVNMSILELFEYLLIIWVGVTFAIIIVRRTSLADFTTEDTRDH